MSSYGHDLPGNVYETLRLIGRKWSLQILHELTHEPLSFGELKEKVAGISASVLSDLLNEFSENDIIEKRVISVSPNKSAYFITEFGKVLCDIIDSITDWGTKYVNNQRTRVNVTKE